MADASQNRCPRLRSLCMHRERVANATNHLSTFSSWTGLSVVCFQQVIDILACLYPTVVQKILSWRSVDRGLPRKAILHRKKSGWIIWRISEETKSFAEVAYIHHRPLSFVFFRLGLMNENAFQIMFSLEATREAVHESAERVMPIRWLLRSLGWKAVEESGNRWGDIVVGHSG